MKMQKLFSVPGTNLAASLDFDSLRKFADQMGFGHVEICEIDVPWLEDGDKIVVDLLAGDFEDEEGISHGGRWISITGTWRQESVKMGSFYNSNGKFICRVGADASYNGSPYRNVRIAE